MSEIHPITLYILEKEAASDNYGATRSAQRKASAMARSKQPKINPGESNPLRQLVPRSGETYGETAMKNKKLLSDAKKMKYLKGGAGALAASGLLYGGKKLYDRSRREN